MQSLLDYYLVMTAVVTVGCFWLLFRKAGIPGWKALVPIYNLYTALEIVEMPRWLLALFFIPLVNIPPSYLLFKGLAEKFGKSAHFGVGLFLLPIFFLPVIAFGDAQYRAGAEEQPIEE